MEEQPIDIHPGEISWITANKLDKVLKDAALGMTRSDARLIVDLFYQQQRQRIRLSNQIQAAKKDDRPDTILIWALTNERIFERNCLHTLASWARQFEIVSEWAIDLYGVGPIICAGLLAHLNEKPPPTVGSWWSFAGLQPYSKALTKEGAKKVIKEHLSKTSGALTREEATHVCSEIRRNINSTIWFATHTSEGKDRPLSVDNLATALARRPWNSKLKTLLWKFGSVQVRLYKKAPEKSFYGTLYYQRRDYEERLNESGKYAEEAARALKEKNYSKSTEAYKHYIKGFLPPGHIHARSLRWIEKVFIAHWHHKAWELTYNSPPPKPWIIEEGGHSHYIEPPG